jgi:GT2 family glycosyltransferase
MYETHLFDIGHSRNKLAELFMQVPEATHILYVDDDIIVPQRGALINMFGFLEKNNESIVSGLYRQKYPPHTPLIMMMVERDGKLLFSLPYKDKEAPLDKEGKGMIFRVGAVPAGFLLIKREVFEKIPPPWFVYDAPELKPLALPEFQRQEIGEDIYFSWKARKHGYKLWVDGRADLIHYCPEFVGRKEIVEKTIHDENLVGEVADLRQNYLDSLKKKDA